MFKIAMAEDATLVVPSSVVDGEVKYRKINGRVCMVYESDFQPAEEPDMEKSLDFLLNCPLPPICGTRVRLKNRVLEIGSFRACRDMDGKLICYRCKAVK